MSWINVDDELPVIEISAFNSDDVLLRFDNGKCLVGYFSCFGEWHDGDEGLPLVKEPTHWMPIPKLPGEEEVEAEEAAERSASSSLHSSTAGAAQS